MKPDHTHKLLAEIGYVNITDYLYSYRVIFPNHMVYAKFIKRVVMKRYLERISVDNDGCKLKTIFLE